ncbi:hypothetical protein ANTQUA_LOCUS3824 [Anthophora quadrimaculata]
MDTFHHKPPLSKEVFEAIKPIYEELSRDDLLNRCLEDYSQNSNESFNATVWNLAPKSYSSGKKVSNIATANAKRIKHSELSLTDAAKEARSNLKASRKENEEEYLNMQGQFCSPGIAD